VSLRVWAPTARSVRVLLYEDSRQAEPVRAVPMAEERGVWRAALDASWKNRFYLYEVAVYVPETGGIATNLVTDPYSRGLGTNSARSQLVDLDDPSLEPEGWDALRKPALAAPEDIALYELHVRDFSAADATVPAPLRGTFLAFTADSDGTRHLRALAEAGISHVHLLPVFDIATIDERRAGWADPGDLSAWPADSEEQQAAIGRIADRDGYNWGYDPFHFGVPEGSYSTDPDGTARILEFRRMVQALAGLGLRTVMDVVYNHTHASGQSDRSVLDRIVPGYYHRLNADGRVETSTCCANTASEHRMMEKLMVDDLVHWARDYRIDGFRFDLMGHHMKRNMEAARDALRALTPERDGVDGSAIYLYGEGWDFGEVGQGKRGVNATQANLAGTGIGTFNDRIRDALRGGSPFTDRRDQGFVSGLFTAPAHNGAGSAERGRLLEQMDRLRAGMAGNLKNYRFVSRAGTEGPASVLGAYTLDPQEAINYASAHDNETLFDKLAWAMPGAAAVEDRARAQTLALGIVALAQGIPFFHAGCEILRSKSFDADSYNSGDWFNRLDFSYRTNNFGAGLPPAAKNRDRWPLMRPLLARRDLAPDRAAILAARDRFLAFLSVRQSSPLFRLRTAEDVQRRLAYLNTGPGQVPGLLVLTLNDEGEGLEDLDPTWRRIVVLANASPEPVTFGDPSWQRAALEIHPALARSVDERVRGAAFDPRQGAVRVPGRTLAVFVEAEPAGR
jgi:pullulanase-type alpha-1,6-glucosidase